MARRKPKRFDGESGSLVSLEEQYPGAKITRGEYQGKPADLPPTDNPMTKLARQQREEELKKSLAKNSLPEYEQKAGRMSRSGGAGRGAGGASGDYMPLDKMLKARKMFYKSGGSVSSASKRADGCAVKGKTKGRFV